MTTTTEIQPGSQDFDFARSECILPARTSVFAYVDQNTGDLRIWASDAAFHCDSELRIAAEDVGDFINGLAELAGRPPRLGPRSEPVAFDAPPPTAAQQTNGDSRPLTNAERQRRYREHKRNGEVTKRNDEGMPRNATALLEELEEH
jgi:hypothetical protein